MSRRDRRPRPHPLGDDRAGRRDPVVGVRQHRHAVPRLPAGRASRGTPSRRSRTRPRSRATPGSRRPSRCTSRGTTVDDFGALAAFASERGIRIGGINSNTFQDEDYKLGSLTPPVAGRAPQGDRRTSSRCCDIARADRVRHRQGLAGRRHQLSRPGRLPGAPAEADRRPQGGVRGAPRQRADGARVQALRAGLLPHGRAGLGPVAVGLPAPRRARPGLRRHRPPRDGASTSSRSSRSCSRRAGSARST